ncbi:hypothetical protein [Streptosporangium sp. V21-05]|uniref:hypothetical protein n=1 Tax=Streptosporangium sp. V21-05 TaxID=3446115 RepID=UPI003F52DE3C
MTEQWTAFDRECRLRGWGQAAAFLAEYARSAQLMGEEANLTERQLRRWRKPNPPLPRPRAWRVLHAMFGMSPAELGFPSPPPSRTEYIERTSENTFGLDRRMFLADTLGTAASIGLSGSDSVGTTHIAELREVLRSLYALDDAYGGGDVRSLAIRHLQRIRRVINTGSYPASVGRQLQLLAGETAEHCGWLHYDADQQDEARRFWGEALTTATMLRDPSLEVMVFASLSMQAIHEDRPRDGYDLARAARLRAEAMQSPILVSMIVAREARALAKMRDNSGARRELACAMRVIERSDRERPAPSWAAFHGQAELGYTQGLIYAETGHHNAAVPFLRAALAHQERTYTRNAALYRITLARSLVLAGEADEAASEAVASLPHLEEVESGRVIRRLREVRNLLAKTDSRTTAGSVKVLSNHLTERAI